MTLKYPSVVRALGAALALTALSVTASALPLSDYNLILSGDYNWSGGDVQGRTLVGGDLNAAGGSPVFGSRLERPARTDGLTVVGDTTADQINLDGGHFVHGGALDLSNKVNRNGGGDVRQQDGLSFDAVFDALEQGSSRYAGMGANGDFVGDQFNYAGEGGTAVFNVDATTVFGPNKSLSLNAGSAETVVINVAGTEISASNSANLVDGFRKTVNDQNIGLNNILWNFHEATDIDFGGLNMKGSVLAPFASLKGGTSAFDGSVAARDYTGDLEFHDYPFDPPTETVSEPSLLALLLAGLGLVGLRRWRRARVR